MTQRNYTFFLNKISIVSIKEMNRSSPVLTLVNTKRPVYFDKSKFFLSGKIPIKSKFHIITQTGYIWLILFFHSTAFNKHFHPPPIKNITFSFTGHRESRKCKLLSPTLKYRTLIFNIPIRNVDTILTKKIITTC